MKPHIKLVLYLFRFVFNKKELADKQHLHLSDKGAFLELEEQCDVTGKALLNVKAFNFFRKK